MINNVVIIGGGPAGYTAAIYTSRNNLKPILYEGSFNNNVFPGGKITMTSLIENYPGFQNGINGNDLYDNLKNQSLKFGTIIETKNIIKIEKDKNIFLLYDEDNNVIKSYSVIIAVGSYPRTLNVPNFNKFFQKGISSCAVCDGILYRNKVVGVIGGGDSACEEALFLSKFVSEVHLFHRRNTLRASKIMIDNVMNNQKIIIHFNSEIIGCDGDKKLEQITVKSKDKTYNMNISGLFLGIGQIPNTEFLKPLNIDLDNNGFIIVKPGTSKTNIKGLFAAGDCINSNYKQIITAASEAVLQHMIYDSL